MLALRVCVLALFFAFFAGAAFAGPAVSSSTHPDSEKWYSNNSPVFQVDPAGVGYSYKMDFFPDTVPGETILSNDSTISFSNRTDGVQYFHVRVKNGGVWSDTTHYKVMIDKTKPLAPQSAVAEFLDDGSVRLSWVAGSDLHSGIAGYKIYRSFLRDFDIRFDFFEVVSEKTIDTFFIDSAVESGKSYHYRLQSIDNVGNAGGLTSSFVARVPPKCDFVPAIQTFLQGDVLTIEIDSSPSVMYFGTIVLRPAFGDEIVVAQNITGVDFVSETVDLSGFADQKFVIDFGVKDRNNDVCDVVQDFFLDRVLPVADWVLPEHDAVVDSNVLLQLSASDFGGVQSGVSKVELYYKKGGLNLIGVVEQAVDGLYSLEWGSLSVPNGRYELVARVFDNAGNFAEESIFVFVQNTALISAQVQASIGVAEQKRASAMELGAKLDLLGLDLHGFSVLLQGGDENLFRAKDVFSRGVNFERALADANAASTLFERAVSFVSVESAGSLTSVFDGPENSFLRVGLRQPLVLQAQQLFDVYQPVRGVEFFKVVSDGNIFYRMVFRLAIGNIPDDVSLHKIKIAEVVPKGLAGNANEIGSDVNFLVLASDPVLVFLADLNKSRSVSYSVARSMSLAEFESVRSANPLKLFGSPPIVLSADTFVDSGTIVAPVDLFELFGGVFGGNGFFSLLLYGVALFVVLFVVLGIISFFVVLVAVLKKQ